MHTNTQADLKQLILTSWKNRWSEKEWSMHTRTYLHNPSDVFHVADALLTQTYVGTTPNSLLLGYLRYGINTGLFSYASVITAISKHEDLHKIGATKGIYRLLHECLSIINQQSLYEDSMDLCCSLRMILQSLLRNTEHYLKGVHDVNSSIAEELIMLNCQALKQLTTKPRTSALLTIARFEESGVWSHIETDLAVIKTSAGQHALHTEISEFCHYVSQLSRCSISPRSVYPQKLSSLINLPVTGLLMLEINNKKLSEPQGIASQLTLLSQIHGLSMTNLLFHAMQACFLGVIDSVESKNDMEYEWIAMLFLRLPKIFSFLKSTARDFDHDATGGSGTKRVVLKFETDLYQSFLKLKQLDSLNDTIDQFCEGVNWLRSLAETFVKSRLLTDEFYIQELMVLLRNELVNIREDRCRNPLYVIKALSNVEHVVNSLNPANCATDPESNLPTFQEICSLEKLRPLLAAAAACSPLLKSLAFKLMQCNDAMKSSSGETNTTAQARAVLFDNSFLIVCHMVQSFGKENVFNSSTTRTPENSLYVQEWINLWWTNSTSAVSPKKYETDPSKVEVLIKVLRSSAEFKLVSTNWNDACTNMPQAVLELVFAKQKGYISFSDLSRFCISIRDGCPFAVSLAVIVAIARHARLTSEHSDNIKLIQILSEKGNVQSQTLAMYAERYMLFEKIVGHLVGDLLPTFMVIPKDCRMYPGRSAVVILKEALNAVKENGWINHACLAMLQHSYKYLGFSSFTKQLMNFILQESRLDAVQTAVDIVYTVIRMDLEAFIIHLLKNFLMQTFLTIPNDLVAPVGPCLAKMLVACLDLALNDSNLQKKSLITSCSSLTPFLYEASQKNESLKIRRLLSCSTEHDLSSSGTSCGISANEPVCVVLSEFIRNLWEMMETNNSGPLAEFVFTFIKLSLYSTPLLSLTTKQFIPVAMARELSLKLVQDSRELLFAATDLGDSETRRIASQAICHANYVS